MALVSHDHSFVYLKTKKTAGTSVEMALETYCCSPGHIPRHSTAVISSRHGIVGARKKVVRKEPPFWKIWLFSEWYNHMPADAVRRNLGPSIFDRYIKITSIRNPFDRMVSYFNFFNRDHVQRENDFQAIREAFRSCVLSGEWTTDFEIVSVDGRVVADHFVRQEHMEEDLGKVVSDLGLDGTRLKIPHEKEFRGLRKGRAAADYFDPETTDRVKTDMAWMFEAGGYSEDPREVAQA